MRIVKMIAGAVVIITLTAVAGFVVTLYKVGEEMATMQRCGCHTRDY